MQNGLVSILTPCYNTGKLVHRLLDSVLVQDYPQVEMFCIDDGSTDNTREVVESYIPKFTEKGYTLTYVFQENGGQSVAINNGLKLINGEFLIWPDSDDYYIEKTAISQFVIAFNQHPRASVVRCYSRFVNEETLEEISRIIDTPVHHRTDLFEDSVFCSNGFYWGAGNYMVRMSALDAAIQNREIYTEKSAGQNWQMIMPLLFKQECITITDYFHNILMRVSSHSRGQFSGYEKTIEKQDVYRRTILGTIKRMPLMMDNEKRHCSNKVEAHYLHVKMQVSVGYGKVQEAISYMNEEVKLTGVKYPVINALICKYCNCKPIFVMLRAIRKLLKTPV